MAALRALNSGNNIPPNNSHIHAKGIELTKNKRTNEKPPSKVHEMVSLR